MNLIIDGYALNGTPVQQTHIVWEKRDNTI